MPYKDPIKRKEHDYKRYHENPERRLNMLARKRANYIPKLPPRPIGVKTWFYQYKATLKCACGESHPACLEFHHRDPSTKLFQVSAFNSHKQNMDVLKVEIAKCDVLCANCHRKLHWSKPLEGPSSPKNGPPPTTAPQAIA
mgnify:CR=1 FL=1